jgi:phosphoribosyl 1,2-cyclic phosphodiesterase
MSFFCPLASGSKGNALLLHSQQGTILVDAGISAKALSERLQSFSLFIEAIQGIVITHEHTDHIAGLKTLALKYNIPVIANYATAEAIVETLGECPTFKIFTTGEPFDFLGMRLFPFSTLHDGVDPVGLTVSVEGKKIGICTDLGFATNTLKHHLQGCNILYIEANHQEELVHASARPDIYKKRVLSRTGHLSNENAARLILDVAHPELQSIYLAHLSSECNTPETALRVVSGMVKQHLTTQIDMSVAFQDKPSIPTFF